MLAHLVLCSVVVAPFEERELGRIAADVTALRIKLKQVIEDYEAKDPMGLRRFSERMADGEILFLLGDYGRAALVLHDLVSDRANTGEPTYPRAVYYLAESLYQSGHDQAARHQFEDLVQRGDAEFLVRSVRRLIQIADRRHHWEGLASQVDALAKLQALPSDIAYIYAKSLLRQGDYGGAIAAAGKVAPDDPLHAKAQYVAAVARMQEGDVEEAAHLFAAITRTADSAPDAAEVRELAAMNQGRLLLEAGRYAASADAYQFVPRTSTHFEEALYEVTWNYVRAADSHADVDARAREYTKARNALEIMLLAGDESALASEARLLLGNILIRLAEYSLATETFDTVVALYRPVRDELRLMAGREVNPRAYFDEIAGQAAGGGVLPPLARRWATGQERLRRAMEVSHGMEQGERMLDEADQMAGKLLSVLDSGGGASLFPALRGAQVSAQQISLGLGGLSERLLTLERQLVSAKLSAAQRAELDQVLARRLDLEPKVRALPTAQEPQVAQASLRETRLGALEQENFRLRYFVQNLRAQLNALTVWVGTERETLSAEAQREYAERIAHEERVAVELEAEQTGLAAAIGREKTLAGLAGGPSAAEVELRAQYAATLDREREILAAAQGEEETRARIEAQRTVIAGFHAELGRFTRRLDDLVRRKSVDVKAEVLREVGLLASHRQAATGVRDDAKLVVGEIAQASFADVERKFQDIVLRADVGIVDVAWALKEAKTHEISRRVNEQNRELKLLDDEFTEVLQEE